LPNLRSRVADTQPLMLELTLAQEKAVVADRTLLVVAICVISQAPAEADPRHLRPERGRSW
jgi:hypothetical protein